MDGIAQWAFFKLIFGFLDHEAEAFRDNLLGETLRWASGIGLILLTLWIMAQGYRIVTGQSHDSMMGLVTRSLRSFLIVSVATSFIFGSTDVYRLLIHGLPGEITLMVTGQAQAPEDLIDQSLDKMQAAMIAIDALSVAGNPGLKDDQDRAQWFTGIGVAGPSVIGGALLLLYKLSLALFVGLGPVFVLSLLFDQTKQLFGRWLYYGLGILFSLAVLSFMVAWTMKLVLALAGGFAAQYLLAVAAGASAQGVSSLAMQQGGVGLVMTVLLIMTPRVAAQFFQGTLGDFAAFSAFGGIGRRREEAVQPGHVDQGQQPTAPKPTHAYRMPGTASRQEDQIKRAPAVAEGSFLERYPNALASSDGHGGSGDVLPESQRGTAAGHVDQFENQRSIMGFEESELTVAGTSAWSPDQIEKVKCLATKDLNAVGDMIRKSGDIELAQRYASMQVQIDFDDWGIKYAGTHAAKGYGQAHFDEAKIVLNGPRIESALSMHDRVKHTVHEIYHLTTANNDLKRSSVGSPVDPIEKTAQEFSNNFMRSYWRPEYEFDK